ncbi:MAG: HAD family phosphatase [Acidimicrobiales bacterium]|nr:HAD family phosphatase [Acidimicrobiales bacterium]
MTPDIQLVVTDLDGTLWEREAHVHERTRAALGAVTAAGLPLVVATGRRSGSARPALSALGLAPPAVLLNGALGLDLTSGTRFHRGGFDHAGAVAVLAAFHDHGVEPCIYIDHDDHPVCVGSAPSTHPDHLVSFGDDVVTRDLVEVVRSAHVLAFGVLGIPDGLARALGMALEAVAEAHVDRDRQHRGMSVTVAPRGRSKWDGVAAFCSEHQLDVGAVMAIGDGPNDIELLANAAVAVVPSDAHPAARLHADHIVGRAEDGGWADILEILGIT